MTNTLGAKPVIDTKEFQNGIKQMNADLRVLKSGFDASVSGMDNWRTSATGLEKRMEMLSASIETQKKKVAATREEYERIKAAKGEDALATKNAEDALNKQIATLGNMEKELSSSEKALDELSQAEEEAGKAADEASGKVVSFSDVIGGIGAVVKGALTVVAALAAAVAAVGVAIGGLVFSSAEAMGALDDLSVKTGLSSTRLQELDYIGRQLGVSQDTMVGSLSRLTRTMSGAQTQYSDYAAAQAEALAKGEEFDGALGDSAAAFDKLGVSVVNADGSLRDREAVFQDTLKALGGISNEAERDAIAMSIFGKSAMELNPLIKSFDEFPRMTQEAHELGAVVGEETKSAFAEFDDTLAGLKMGLQGTLTTLAGSFLPGFSLIFDQLGGYLKDFKGIVDGSGDDIGKMAEGVGGLISTIIADVAAQVPQLMQTGMTILMSIVDAILENLPMMISTGVELLLKLVDGLVTALPALVEAGLKAIIELANGLTQALPTLIPTIVQVILTIVQILVENLPLLIDAALQLILALTQGLLIALPTLIAAIPQLIAAIVTAILNSLPMIGSAALQLIVALAYGLLSNIPVLVVAVGELFVAVGSAILDFIKQTPERGKDIIRGLTDGIKSSTGMLYDAITNVINGMIARIRSLLDMHSPSGVGLDIGGNFFGSIGLGGEDEAPKVRRMLTRQMLGLANDLSAVSAPQMGISAAGGVGSGAQINIGDIIINIPGTNATPQQVAVAAENGVLKAMRARGLK